ncbi:MAG TPA: alpha/beta hydrolase [Thermomicrobiales bacterium]|nr:alpha/beta hydrolase [Thermomicrobiales bacterium]
MTATIGATGARMAATIAEYRADPEAFAGIAGVPPALAARLPGWLDEGFAAAELLDACRAIPAGQLPGSPAWVGAFGARGDAHEGLGRVAEARGDADRARVEYLTAAFYFFLARFPHIFSPDARAAYRRHQDAYLRAASTFDPPLEVVRLPLDGGEVVGYLRVPRRPAGPPPVVVLSGGLDVWKSDSELHGVAEALLAAGLATLALDAPGTGENPLPAAPGAERAYTAAIAHLKARPDVAGDRIGCFGLSFGGHWAVRLWCVSPDLRAVVNVGGPVHHTFAPAWCAELGPGLLAPLAVMLGEDFAALGPRGVCARLGALSLVDAGLLAPQPGAPALLSINGARDEQVTIADLAVISERGVPQDSLVFASDRHVASRNRALHLPFAVRWLAHRLGGEATAPPA